MTVNVKILNLSLTLLLLMAYRKSVIAGMTAGAFGQFIASPTDLVKVQMQMEGKRVLVEGRQPRYDIIIYESIHNLINCVKMFFFLQVSTGMFDSVKTLSIFGSFVCSFSFVWVCIYVCALFNGTRTVF